MGSLNLLDTTFNSGLNWYLNTYLFEIGGSSNTIAPIDSILKPLPYDPIDPGWTQTEKICEPLIKEFKSLFHQNYPYNKYCFTTGSTPLPALVGCTALAAGTIMSYYEWPNQAYGYSFSWDDMNNSKYHDMWSRLFEILGRPVNLNVRYGVSSSGVSFEDLKSGILRTFSNMQYKASKVCEISHTNLTSELRSGNPVYCWGLSDTGGHAWVIDGGYTYGYTVYPITPEEEKHKEYSTYIHCVWSWGGNNNGYYLLSSKIGGTCYNNDPGTSGTASSYGNLWIGYGFRPNKQ